MNLRCIVKFHGMNMAHFQSSFLEQNLFRNCNVAPGAWLSVWSVAAAQVYDPDFISGIQVNSTKYEKVFILY